MSKKASVLLFMAVASVALAPKASADLIHEYDLTSSFNDTLGGPSLTHSGSLGPSGYSFLAGQGGLTLSNALPDPATYTIEISFELDTVSSGQRWSDILNFHNSDFELYDYCGVSSDHGATSPCTLQLFPNTGAGGILSNTFTDLIFSRDGSNNTVQAWLNGVQIIADLNDSGGTAIFNDTNNIIRFFKDDPATSGEDSNGTVTSINIYDKVYTPSNIPEPSIPEPATLTLLGTGTIVLLGKLRRRA